MRLVVVALVLSLTGCAGADAPAQPSAAPASQGRFVDAGALGEALTAGALAAGSATGEVDVAGPDGTVRGTTAYRFEPTGTDLAARATVTGSIDADVGLVLLDDQLYLEVPPAYRWLVPTPWVRTPVDGPAAGLVGTTALLTALPGSDLAGAGDDARLSYLGRRQTDAGPMEVYRVDQAEDSRMYWVGADDLLSQVQVTAADGTTSTATYGDWGAPVSIDPPPADEVSDLPG